MESIKTITRGKIILEDFLTLMTLLETVTRGKKQIYTSGPVESDDRRLKKICVAIFMDVAEIAE